MTTNQNNASVLCPNVDWTGLHCPSDSCRCINGVLLCDCGQREAVTTMDDGTGKPLPLCAECFGADVAAERGAA